MIDTKDMIEEQIRAICIYQFLKLYNVFEKKIRETFESDLQRYSSSLLQELYFYYGSKYTVYVDFGNQSIVGNDLKFKSNEKFKNLTVNNILKFSNKHSEALDITNIKLPSARERMVEYYFYDIAIKLIDMRNKMAHEMVELDFSKCVIDMMPIKFIDEQKYVFLTGYDLNKMDQISRDIMCNYYYMKCLLEVMEKR